MKNVFLSMVAVALSLGAFAQETTPNPDSTSTAPTEQQAQQQTQKDMYVFKNSKNNIQDQPYFNQVFLPVWLLKDASLPEILNRTLSASGTSIANTQSHCYQACAKMENLHIPCGQHW